MKEIHQSQQEGEQFSHSCRERLLLKTKHSWEKFVLILYIKKLQDFNGRLSYTHLNICIYPNKDYFSKIGAEGCLGKYACTHISQILTCFQ